MNLTLTPDEADRLTADGSVTLYRPGIADPATFSAMGGVLHPPVEFAEAAKPCETCVAIMECGIAYDWPDHGCIDGKRRVTAVVPCEMCDSGTPCGGEPSYGVECVDGVVLVATVVVEWGPTLQDDGRCALHVKRVS